MRALFLPPGPLHIETFLPSPGTFCGSAHSEPYSPPGHKMVAAKVKGKKLDKKLGGGGEWSRARQQPPGTIRNRGQSRRPYLTSVKNKTRKARL